MAEYIAQDLESRILSGDQLPEKFTLGALAQRYDVSATPVRLALESLIQKDLVIRLSNGRLKLNPPNRKRRSVDLPEKPTDWESVLAHEVLILSLKGEDCFLREEAMAERHGIGRTLLRRVFHRLAGGGLLTHVPRRGWQVRPFVENDMDAFVDIRETLETKALELAKPNVVNDDLEHMLAGNSSAQVTRGEIDNDLHRYFVEKSGNRYIESFFDLHGGYYMALFDYAMLGTKVIAKMAGQHCEILEHTIHRRWAKARTALTEHIQAQKPVMRQMVTMLRDSEAA